MNPRLPEAARGIALINALFILVVLAMLGAFMASMSTVQQATPGQSASGTRVYHGAKTGLEWGIQRAVAQGLCDASTSFTLAEQGLNGVALTVTCASTAHGTSSVYYLTSKATVGGLGGPTYAERRMEATVSNLP
ncbi:MAG: pilus assembly protein MshP [Betaproteobacteria bacterium]|nr:pilus assembly protein MshP [Betaproteobacteria bacterium]